jgi:hypothetical protein
MQDLCRAGSTKAYPGEMFHNLSRKSWRQAAHSKHLFAAPFYIKSIKIHANLNAEACKNEEAMPGWLSSFVMTCWSMGRSQ